MLAVVTEVNASFALSFTVSASIRKGCATVDALRVWDRFELKAFYGGDASAQDYARWRNS